MMVTTANDRNLNPIAILLVTSGTRGDRLLYKYPVQSESSDHPDKLTVHTVRNPYAVKISEDHQTGRDRNQRVTGKDSANSLDEFRFTDQILANLLAVKSDLCSKKFNIKVDDVHFIGYPMLFDPGTTKTQASSGKSSHQIISFSIILALKDPLSLSVINCYHDLMKQLTVAVHYEERKRQYLSQQAKIMLAVHDEVASMPEEDNTVSPFALILKRSSLAQDLKTLFESICESGMVQLFVNDFILVSFCLPHKVHRLAWTSKSPSIEPELIQRCVESLRPYHGILLLTDKQSLLDSLPLDGTQSLNRLISVTSPFKSLQTLALEADLSLSQVFQLVSHLVYWAKATMIYPLCGTNIYVLSPTTTQNSSLNESFVATFRDKSLSMELSEFSFPVQLRDTRDILDHPVKQEEKVQIVLWLLQHKLIIQQHLYIFFVPHLSRRKKKTSEDISRMMPILPEESLAYVLENPTEMQRASSISDVASVNSDESVTVGPSGVGALFSKSPSSEIASDSSQVSEDMRGGIGNYQDGLSHLSKEERECVLNVPAAKIPEDLKLFSRLCPYFNGKHHVEEIMYYENLHRAHLMTLLDKFREVLIMCQYQDPATAMGIR